VAKVSLIDSISIATNRQTTVIAADRYSNEPYNLELQKLLFDYYGLLYERKRGEFQDGVHQQYIGRDQILERNLFFRVYLSANGHLKRAVEKKAFERSLALRETVPTKPELDRFYFAYLCLPFLAGTATLALRGNRELAGKLYALASWFTPLDSADYPAAVAKAEKDFGNRWSRFVLKTQSEPGPFLKSRRDKRTGEEKVGFNSRGWLASDVFLKDVKAEMAAEGPKPAASLS
jgi:AIPR protein